MTTPSIESEFQNYVRELIAEGRYQEVLAAYRFFADREHQAGRPISLKTLRLVEQAVDRLAVRERVTRRPALATALAPGLALLATAGLVALVGSLTPSRVARCNGGPMTIDQLLLRGDRDYQSAHYREALEWDGEALYTAKSKSDLLEAAHAGYQVGRDQVALGEMQSARSTLTSAASAAGSGGDPLRQAVIMEALGELDTATGDFDEGRALLTRSRAIRAAKKDPTGVNECDQALVELETAAGRLEEAQRLLELMIIRMCENQDPELCDRAPRRAALWSDWATLECRQGHVREAERLIAPSLAFWLRQNHTRWIASTQVRMSEIARAGADPKRAADLAADARDRYRAVGDRGGEARASEQLGLALQAQGDSAAAKDALAKARDYAERSGLRPMEARLSAEMHP